MKKLADNQPAVNDENAIILDECKLVGGGNKYHLILSDFDIINLEKTPKKFVEREEIRKKIMVKIKKSEKRCSRPLLHDGTMCLTRQLPAAT